MAAARTASALKFMVDSQLQVLLATPPDKAAGLLPYVDSARTIMLLADELHPADERHPIEIDKAEMMKELEAE